MSSAIHRKVWRGMAAGLAGVMGCAGLAYGGGEETRFEPGLDDAWLSARVMRLDDADFAAREAASNEIAARTKAWTGDLAGEMAGMPELTPEERRARLKQRIDDRNRAWLGAIEARLAADGGLSPEQRERLVQAGTRLFSELPHGAMGVQFSRLDRGEGVEISAVVNGFDAENTLKPGDTVMEIDGRKLSVQADMRAVIISHDPGDRLNITLMRRGERAVVSLRLGDFANLRAPALTDRSLIRDAFEERIARRAGKVGAIAGIIEPGIDSGAWAKLRLSSGDSNWRFRRGARAEIIDAEGVANGKMAEIGAGGADRVAGVGDPAFSANQPAQDEARIRDLLTARQQLVDVYTRTQQAMKAANDGRSKLIIQSQLRNVEAQIQGVDRQILDARGGQQKLRVRGGFVRP